MTATPLIEKINNKLTNDNLENLEPWERDYYIVYYLLAEVCNGGMFQYLWNSSGVHAPEAAHALKRWGFDWIAGLVDQAAVLFSTEDYPRNRKARIDLLEEFSEEKQKILESLTSHFYEVIDDIQEKLEAVEEEREGDE